jgi:anaerobic ribonucleoside-triphosphate reductase activating protein
VNYLKIDKEDVCNGEGLRVVLWLSGCSHKCKGCQNPQTWDANSGILFDESAKEELFRELDKDYISGLTLSGGDPLFEGNLGDVLDLVTEVNKRYNTTQYIDENNQNNHNILNTNADKIRLSSPQKSIWLYTGYTIYFADDCNKKVLSAKTDNYQLYAVIPTVFREKILEQCDIVIDGRYVENQRDITLPYRGSKNQHIIDVKQSLQKGEMVLWDV